MEPERKVAIVDRHGRSAGTVTVYLDSTYCGFMVNDHSATVALPIEHPDAMCELAAVLMEMASQLQDRIDVANGDGGDQ